MGFDMGKNCFDGIELWTCRYVENRGDFVFFVLIMSFISFVDGQLVHEEVKWLSYIFSLSSYI